LFESATKINRSIAEMPLCHWSRIVVLLIVMCFSVLGCSSANLDTENPSIEYLESKTDNLYGLDNLPEDSLFTPIQGTPHLSFNSDHWFRYGIPEHLHKSSESWYLQVAFPSIDAAKVYLQLESTVVTNGLIGDDVPHRAWPVTTRLPTVPLNFKGEQVRAVYLNFEATGQPAVLPVSLISQNAFETQQQNDYLWYGLFFGATFALILYNFLLYLSTQIKSYLTYVFYLLPFTILQASITGVGQQYLWPALSDFTTVFALCLIALTNSMMALFVTQFLDLNRLRPAAHRLLCAIAIVSMIFPIGLIFFEYIYIQNIQHVFSLISMVVITIIAVREVRKNSKPAVYLLISYSMLFLGIITSLLLFNGMVKSNFFTSHFMEVAIIFEAVVLSYGLSRRLSEIQDKARALEKKTRLDQETYTKQLISAHESEKQHFGAILHDDIGHRVLNLQYEITRISQTDSSLSAQTRNLLTSCASSAVDIMDELRHLSIDTHPHLLAELGLERAIESLMQRALQSAVLEYSCAININEIDRFPTQQLYRIVQELLSNTIKHAEASEVLLNITQMGDTITLLYKDDGIGLRTESLEGQNGFGVISIRERCKLIRGTLSFAIDHPAGMSCSIEGIVAREQ